MKQRRKTNSYFIYCLVTIILFANVVATYPASAIPGIADSLPATTTTTTTLSPEEQKKVEKKVDKIEDKIADKQEDLETLEQKARNYQKMIDLKKQQQTTLQNQLQLMDIQVDSFSNSVEITKEDITKNNEEINRLQVKVNDKQKEMEKVKEEMSEMIRAYNELDEELALQMLSSKGDISLILNNSEYLDQASQRVSQMLDEIAKKKLEYEEVQKSFAEKNEELKTKKNQLEEKLFYLNNEKSSKDILLKETQGEEAKYKELLSRVEAQKTGIDR